MIEAMRSLKRRPRAHDDLDAGEQASLGIAAEKGLVTLWTASDGTERVGLTKYGRAFLDGYEFAQDTREVCK